MLIPFHFAMLPPFSLHVSSRLISVIFERHFASDADFHDSAIADAMPSFSSLIYFRFLRFSFRFFAAFADAARTDAARCRYATADIAAII